MDPEQLGQLADDMAANGLLQPIGLRGPSPAGRYEIIWGDRRHAAAKLLLWPRLRARVCPWETEPLVARAAENLQRSDLSPLEEALMIAEQRQAGQPDAAIARLFRRSAEWVNERVELLQLPEDLQQEVHNRRLALRVARALAGIDHSPYRQQLIDEAIRTGATARTVDVWAAHYAADRTRIITNQLTIQEIVVARESFVIYFGCEACHQQVPYTETRSMRFCSGCAQQLVLALASNGQNTRGE